MGLTNNRQRSKILTDNRHLVCPIQTLKIAPARLWPLVYSSHGKKVSDLDVYQYMSLQLISLCKCSNPERMTCWVG